MRRAILIALTCVSITALQITLAQVQDEPISARKIVSKVQPQYPPLAHAAHVTGMAKLLVKVSPNGKVASVDVLGGHPLLAQAATIAVNQWKWEPSTQPTQETVVVKFSLQE
jgi:periplasmic protein TonB